MSTAGEIEKGGHGGLAGAYEKVCHAALFMLLPGFFIYQTSLALGLIPAFAGGYFSAACFVVLPFVLVLYFCACVHHGRIKVIDLAYFLFLIYFSTVALSNYAVGAPSYLLEWHLISIIQMLCVYIIFRGILAGLKRYAKGYILISLCLSLIVFALSSEGVFNPSSLVGDQVGLVSYQGFALVLFLLSCLSIGCMHILSLRMVLYVVFAAALYLNGARSEFAGFIIFFVLFEFSASRNRVLGSLFILLVAFVAISIVTFELVEVPANRVTNLINLEADNSSQVRDELSSSGFSTIMDSPLLGSYGDYDRGFYIHNILSSWMDLGFLGFIVFLLLMCLPVIILIIKVFDGSEANREDCFVLAMLGACLTLLIFGKYFTYLVSPACLGLYASLPTAKKLVKSEA